MVDLDPRRKVDESAPRLRLPKDPVVAAKRAVGRNVVPKGWGAGKRFRLLRWEHEVIEAMYGPARPAQMVLRMPRANGKTSGAAAIAKHEATGAGKPDAEVIVFGPNERHALGLLHIVRRLVENDPLLAPRARVYSDQIVFPALHSRIRALPGEPSGLLGLDFDLAIGDEIGALTPEAWDAVVTAAGKRPGSLVFGIGSPVPGGTDLLARLIDYGATSDDPSFWIRNYCAPDGCAVDDEDGWRIANPAYGVLVHAKTMRHLAATMPEPAFRAYRLGQQVEDIGTWLPPGAWTACADATRVVEDGAQVALGFDGSYSGDSTALVGCTVGDEVPHVFVVDVWANPGDPNWRVPRIEVHAAVERAFDRWKVRSLVADPWGWREQLEVWERQFGDDVILEWPTNSLPRMGPACDRFYTAIRERSMTHDGDTVLAAHVGHARTKTTTYGSVITKDRRNSPRKIDAAVAAVIAFDRAAQVPKPRSRRVVAF